VTTAILRVRPRFDHLARLTDEQGLFEHARYSTPRPEHGYCLDDAARALVVVCREPGPDPPLQRLGHIYLRFVLAALQPDGRCRNRMDAHGRWTDEPGLGDWWGRALWGLGVAAIHAPTEGMRTRALYGFRNAARQRSPHTRAMAFAALGAGELLSQHPGEPAAQSLLHDSANRIVAGVDASTWPWPEPRLTYANGSLVEALLLAGSALPDVSLLSRGLYLLRFLSRVETRDGHLSVTPTGGRGPHDPSPGFDQQPIEAAALADACARAHALTSDPSSLITLRLAWLWFLGDNDSNSPMLDAATGAGFDGLERDGHNLNQGAESTLAMLSTAQHARRLGFLQ
jgi:hypothetical protein